MKYAYVLNRSPSRSNPVRKSPLELFEGDVPSLLNIVVFGSTYMVYRDSNGRTFKKRAAREIILGVPEETKGCIVYLKEMTRSVTLSMSSILRPFREHKIHRSLPLH